MTTSLYFFFGAFSDTSGVVDDKKIAHMEWCQVYEPGLPVLSRELNATPTQRQLLWGYPIPNPVRFSIISSAPTFGMQYGMVSFSSGFGELLPQHPYFDFLASQSTTILSTSFRIAALIEADRDGDPPAAPHVVYDPVEDAAKACLCIDSGTLTRRIVPEHADVTSGTLFYTWDVKWHESWQTLRSGLNTHQSFELIWQGLGDERRITLLNHYGDVDELHENSTVDMRLSFWEAAGSEPVEPEPDNDFIVHSGVWTRYWLLVDLDNEEITLWVGDRSRGAVKVYNALSVTLAGNGVDATTGLNAFRFKFQDDGECRLGIEMCLWFRNFVVMQDPADPQALVDAGLEIPEDICIPVNQ